MEEFTILGKKVSKPMKKLEAFNAPEDVKTVILTSDEVTSLCPITGQPDWYTIEIEYQPNKLCLESKSLKLYFWTFREEGHFCEQLSNIILKDVQKAINPKTLKVTVEMRPRGGIKIRSIAEI
ncbi:MAG: preQ(1) synthase [Candidatus Humimicrobiaceae bacterium]